MLGLGGLILWDVEKLLDEFNPVNQVNVILNERPSKLDSSMRRVIVEFYGGTSSQ